MIRFATVNDIPMIMKFIDDYWKKNHILARDKVQFKYEYLFENKVNIVISIDEDNFINGFEGFIPYGKKNRTIMLAVWKVIKSDNPVLGLELLKFLIDNADAKIVACAGINQKVIPLYEYMGFKTGCMTQWYRLNSASDYKIALVKNSAIPKCSENQLSLVEFKTFLELKNRFDFEKYYSSNPKPLKEDWYVEKRYFNHPIYKYNVYGIEKDGSVETLCVFRVQECNGSCCLRFVDVIGKFENVYSATKSIDELLKTFNAEYVDFYEVGLDESKMIEAGWLKAKESGNIIPNYFSPYCQENINIYYCTQDPEIKMFKGDGDQDRPS